MTPTIVALAAAAVLPLVAGLGTPQYVARATVGTAAALLEGADERWAGAERICWGPETVATCFRALWTDTGLAVRYDVTDASPWSTLTKFDERLWTEEVVELFLDVGATGRSYAEFEWNPAGAVVDLWIDRADNRFDKDWNAAGFASRVFAAARRRRPHQRLDGARLRALERTRAEGAAGHGAAPEAGRPLALQRVPHRPPVRAHRAGQGRPTFSPGPRPASAASTCRPPSGIRVRVSRQTMACVVLALAQPIRRPIRCLLPVTKRRGWRWGAPSRCAPVAPTPRSCRPSSPPRSTRSIA